MQDFPRSVSDSCAFNVVNTTKSATRRLRARKEFIATLRNPVPRSLRNSGKSKIPRENLPAIQHPRTRKTLAKNYAKQPLIKYCIIVCGCAQAFVGTRLPLIRPTSALVTRSGANWSPPRTNSIQEPILSVRRRVRRRLWIPRRQPRAKFPTR